MIVAVLVYAATVRFKEVQLTPAHLLKKMNNNNNNNNNNNDNDNATINNDSSNDNNSNVQPDAVLAGRGSSISIARCRIMN